MTQIAKIVRSGDTFTIQLPAGFDVGEGEMEIIRHGQSIELKPIASPATPGKHEWAWLDRFAGPLDADFLAALEEDPGEPEIRDFFCFK